MSTSEAIVLCVPLIVAATDLLFVLRRFRARRVEHEAVLRHVRAYCLP